MKEKIEKLVIDAESQLSAAATSEALAEIKVKYLGKSGLLTDILRSMKDVPPAERPLVGTYVNEARNTLESAFATREKVLAAAALSARLKNEVEDITVVKTLPAAQTGTLHPLEIMQERILNLFTSLGFKVLEGPEIETDYYNFQALNIPQNHPARDMQDTFYITQNLLLRTHTSPNQVRLMEKQQPPIKMVCPGRVYRADSDASHSPIFHQIEGLVVDENVTLCDLLGTLEYMAREIFDPETKVRFRPSFFPFTEPSVEVDLTCPTCRGVGCPLCKGTGWLEVLGAGMVHPFVLENAGIDSKKYTGFAFGFGIERMTMIRYGIPDIRLFYENDIRFLKQFKG